MPRPVPPPAPPPEPSPGPRRALLRPPGAAPGLGIVFLAYLSRSGSTYLCTLLDAHPEIVVTPEAWVPDSLLGAAAASTRLADGAALDAYLGYLFDDEKLASWGIGRERLRAVVAGGAAPPWPTARVLRCALALYAGRLAPAARWVVFKEGRRALAHPEAARAAYPGCRILHLVRDPRAVFASQRRARRSRHPLPFTLSPAALGAAWRTDAERAARLARDGDFLQLTYEGLIRDVAGSLERVLRWLGCDPAPAADLVAGAAGSDYRERIPEGQRHLHRDLVRRPDPSRLEAWREALTLVEQTLAGRAAGPRLAALGYPPPPSDVRPGARPRALHRLGEAGLRAALRLFRGAELLRSPGRLTRRLRAWRRGW